MGFKSSSSPSTEAYSVEGFCKAHGISRALFYLIQRDRTGPAVMRVRGRTLISREAAAAWRARMETAQEAA